MVVQTDGVWCSWARPRAVLAAGFVWREFAIAPRALEIGAEDAGTVPATFALGFIAIGRELN